MRKVKHDFQVANREISFGNVCMIQNCFTFLRGENDSKQSDEFQATRSQA